MVDCLKIGEFVDYRLFGSIISKLINHFKSSLELKGKLINSFVLLMDESAMVSDCIDHKKGISGNDDVFQRLPGEIYDHTLHFCVSSIMIMTTVKDTIFYDRTSRKPISKIILADLLDINQIVDRIFIPTIRLYSNHTINEELLIKDRDRLLMLASIVYTAPRSVEIVKLSFIDYFTSNRSEGNEYGQMNNMMSYIYNNLMKNLNTHYNDKKFLKYN